MDRPSAEEIGREYFRRAIDFGEKNEKAGYILRYMLYNGKIANHIVLKQKFGNVDAELEMLGSREYGFVKKTNVHIGKYYTYKLTLLGEPVAKTLKLHTTIQALQS